MAQLQRLTGDPMISSVVDQYDQEIGNIMDEANRQADLLDSLNNTYKIISKGSVTLNYDGSGAYPFQTVAINSGTTSSFLAYMVRSDDASRAYSIPYYLYTGSGGSMAAQMTIFANVSQNNITFSGLTNGTYIAPASVTIYYFMAQQPANTSS